MLRRFASLPGDDRRLLLAAMSSLLVADLGLRVLGFRRLSDRIVPAAPSAPVRAGDLERSQCYRRWIDAASRHHPARTQCLQRSLVLHWWLRREGVPSELRIGVRKKDGRFEAHAWVELGEYVLNDPVAKIASFAPLEPRIARELLAGDGTTSAMAGR